MDGHDGIWPQCQDESDQVRGGGMPRGVVLDQWDVRRLQGRLESLSAVLVEVAVSHGPDDRPAGQQALADHARDLALVGAEQDQLASAFA